MNKENDYEYIPHNFKKRKFLPWSVCRGCGLLTLNTKFTEWAINKGCDNYWHPGYSSAKSKFTKLEM